MDTKVLDVNVLKETKETGEKILQATKCICPSCGKVIPTAVVKRDGYIYLIKRCIFENKTFESLLEKANQFWEEKRYENLKCMLKCNIKLGQDRFNDKDIINLKRVGAIFFLVTQRCNSHCPICFDKYWLKRPDMNPEFIRKKLKKVKYKNVYLSGGEPTVREDLPYLIRIIKSQGISQGLLLMD